MMQKRRGLSTVVGGIFMVIIMIGALNAYLYVTQEQGRVWSALTGESNANQNRLNEKIEITNVRVDGSRLNVTVTNTGGQVANIKSLYIVNETASTQYRYDISKIVDSRNSAVGIGQDSAITTVKSNAKYIVKVVTASGNSASAVVTPVSDRAWPMSLYVIPPTVSPGANVTVLFVVTNNSTDSYIAGSATPDIDAVPSGCSPVGPNCQLIAQGGPTPSSAAIAKGATAIFKQTFLTDVPANVNLVFNASLTDATEGNYVIEKGRVRLFDAQTAEQIISEELYQKPSIFLTIPSSFGIGDGNDQGLWGVSVVNPTDQTMTVSRVVFTGYSPDPASTMRAFAANCADSADTEIYPTTEAEWTCPSNNLFEWKDLTTPETVSPVSAKSFMARVVPGQAAATSVSSFIVVATVFTNMGQFSSINYSSGMESNNGPIANVYMTNTTSTTNALVGDFMRGHLSGITANSVVTMNVTVADFDDPAAAENYIKSGTKLIVNVPKGFTEVDVIPSSGFTLSNPETVIFEDGSTQIVATLNEDVGNAGTEAKVLQFTAKAPNDAENQMYVLHALLDGTTDSDFSVGAFAQIPLQVVP